MGGGVQEGMIRELDRSVTLVETGDNGHSTFGSLWDFCSNPYGSQDISPKIMLIVL